MYGEKSFPSPFSPFLMRRQPVSVNTAASHIVFPLSAGVTGVSFHGMGNAILTVFHDAYIVNGAIGTPVKEDDVPGYWPIGVRLPLPLRYKPVYIIGAYREARYDPGFNVSALGGTPGNKTDTHHFKRLPKPHQDQ